MITLTDSAATKVGELIAAEGDEGLALRVAVRPGGCSGFSYEMYFDTDRAEDDQTLSYGNVAVVVDPSSAMLLEGATLDYKDGLDQSGFAITNPNASRTCGCETRPRRRSRGRPRCRCWRPASGAASMRRFSLRRSFIVPCTFSRMPVCDSSSCWKTSALRKIDSVVTVARTVADRVD